MPSLTSNISSALLAEHNISTHKAHRDRFVYYVAVGAIAGMYLIAGKLSLALASVHPNVAAVWPPSGIALAVLVCLGYRLWPGIFIGSFLTYVIIAGSFITSFAIAAGNTLEALIGAYLVFKFAEGVDAFLKPKNVIAFILCGGIITPIIGASIGTATLLASALTELNFFLNIWLTWWFGGMAGILIFAPAWLLWFPRRNHSQLNLRMPHYGEFVAMLAMTIILASVVFGLVGAFKTPITMLSAILMLPIALWTVYRFNSREASLLVVAFSTPAILGTVQGFGPFVHPAVSQNISLELLQLSLAIVSVSILTIASFMELYREQQKTLEESQKSEEMRADIFQKSAREKARFINILGHELRNPLATVLLTAEVLLQKYRRAAGSASKETDAALETILHETGRMSRYTQDILDLARISRGTFEINPNFVDIRTAVKNAVRSLRPVARETNQRMSLTVPKETVHALVDPLRIEQILVNLTHNAIKYNKPKGKIDIAVKCEGDKKVHIHIKDEGIGVNPDRIEHLFGAGYGDNVTKGIEWAGAGSYNKRGKEKRGRGRGLGIGLSLSRELARLNGGDITASSEGPGRGSTFTLSLPITFISALAREKTKIKREPALFPKTQKRVLVVDDNKKLALAIKELLEQTGAYKTEIAFCGKDALRIYPDFNPDIVLLDINMPYDGHKVAAEIKKDPRFASIPIIALSGYEQEHYDPNFTQQLVKPIRIEELQRALSTAA